MQLEDYFDFEKLSSKFGEVEQIRIKGHRIAIEIVINDWKAGLLPEQIVAKYPTLNLEKVFATLTYYLHNRQQVEDYIKQGETVADGYYQEYLQRGPHFLRDDASQPGAVALP